MPAARQRRAPLIYVAGSARELPPSMQEWLGRADVRAVASAGIYDVLALLARRKRFQAIVVHMDAVDWSEMDFFDHAARLSQGVPIYVVGQPYHAAKMEAACRRGAQPFDVDMLSERLKYPEVPVATQQDEAAEPLFDRLQPSAPPPTGRENIFSFGHRREHVIVPEPAGHEETAADEVKEPDQLADIEALAAAELAGNEAPVVPEAVIDELTEADSVDVADATEEADEAPVIAFPWTANANRPKRTPPRQSPPDDPQGNPAEPERSSGRERKFIGVRLTAEEIAALMGRPPGDAAPPGKEAQA